MTGLAAFALGLALVVPGDVASPAGQAASDRCSGQAPKSLEFDRKPGRGSGRLSWKAPRAGSRARYRVYRDRDVVGQTSRRFIAIRVEPGRKYRFTVRVVSPRAGRVRCAAHLVQRVRYLPPSRPARLVVGDASGPTVRLSWSPSRDGDSPLAGYRVLRDGAVLTQTRGQSLEVAIASNRTYEFTVAGVDRRGRLGPQSRPVTVRTGHRPPPSPTGLTVTGVSESTVTLRWTGHQPVRGRLAGHQIYRDGVVVRRVGEESAVIGNLAPAKSHAFSVASVDNLGYVSAPTEPVYVTTAPPEPTTGHAHAFLLASTDRSFVDFQENYRQIGVVYPTYYDCTAATLLVGRNDPLITDWARLRGVRVMPRVNCQSGAVLHRILNEPAIRARWLDELDALAAANAFDGLALDFEAGYPEDRAALTSFVGDLASRLHRQGKALSMAVSAKTRDLPDHPRSGFYDYQRLADHADHIVVMAWGLHWAASAPGAPDELGWWTDVADYVASMPRKEKFLMGLQLYGMDWPAAGGPSSPATAYEHADIEKLRIRMGATPIYDPVADATHFTYEDLAGIDHTVWYTDATTQATRIQIARQRGVGGVAFWRLGREDQRLWDNPLLRSRAGWPP